MSGDNALSSNQKKTLLNADVYQYNALSDGHKKIYTNDDELTEYGDRGILDPNEVSFFNLFINGVLQPKVNYEIHKGLLFLKTEDVPIKGSTIIISFITLEDKSACSAELNSALVEGVLPSGVISGGPVTDISICVRDNISNCLHLESTFLRGPACIPSGCKGTWEFALTISNITHIPITNIVITDTILLDIITNIENTSVSCGSVLIKDGVITWEIDALAPCESAIACFGVAGFFQAEGTRYIGRSMASGSTVLGSVSTDIICTNPIDVCQGLELVQTITSGPLKVNVNTVDTWRVEIKISNLSDNTVSDILIRDVLFINCIKCIKIISVSNGKAVISGHELLWKIDVLRESDAAVLVADITGCFFLHGLKTLGIASGVGCMNSQRIFSNPSQDFEIAVFPEMNAAKQKLLLQTYVFNRTMNTFSGYSNKWTFSLNITNTDNEVMRDLVVIDYILLDECEDIIVKSIKSGKILVSDNSVIWKIKELLPCETLTVIIEVDGLFNTTGCRSLCRAIAGVSNSTSCIISDIASGYPIKVISRRERAASSKSELYFLMYAFMLINPVYSIFLLKNRHDFFLPQNLLSVRDRSIGSHENINCPDLFGSLMVEKYIVSGPLEVNANEVNTWRVELRISNHGHGPVSNVVMTDTLILDELVRFKPISFTKGMVSKKNKIITWDIGTLNSKSAVVLSAEITGSFHKRNCKLLDVSDYQYNTVSNGIKKAYTNKDELLIYGNYGIPDPNKVSLLNLYINGVLQPEANYSVKPGLLTLTITEPPKEDVPIILEYLVIKDKKSRLIKAKTYQYNAVSNGGKIYTDADEIIVYGDRGIPDPNQTSYYNLFVNGVLQPRANYTIEKGSLTLTVSNEPMEESPILVKFVSLYV